jgi:thioredoxin 1
MSEHIHYVTDDSLCRRCAAIAATRAGRLLGRMVRPLQDDRADPRRNRQGLCRPLKVAKLNIDDNQETPASYGIRGIPTLMLFKNGNVEATKVGALSKSQLTAFIDSNL